MTRRRQIPSSSWLADWNVARQEDALNTRSLFENDPNCIPLSIVLPVVSFPMHHVVDTVYFIENNPIHFQGHQLSNETRKLYLSMWQTVLLPFCTEAPPKVWVQKAKDLAEKPRAPSIPVSKMCYLKLHSGTLLR